MEEFTGSINSCVRNAIGCWIFRLVQSSFVFFQNSAMGSLKLGNTM